MPFSARLSVLLVPGAVVAFAGPAAADDAARDGYGSGAPGSGAPTYELDVSHDGYVREGEPAEAIDPKNYVVIETEDGTTEQYDGETIIVVQEPEPVVATAEPPPPPQTVVVEQPVTSCPGGIWVDGYWYYSNGDYVWVDGHCVVERVNYVFVHPRWDYYANVWWFVPGYYRPCGVWVGFGYHRPWWWFPPYHRPYYYGHRGVPVHRGVPRRATTVHPAPRGPSRGVVARPTSRASRTPTVGRQLPPGYRRGDTVSRVGSTPRGTDAVVRRPTRAPTVTRGPTVTRRPTVSRTPTTSRAPTLGRAGTGPTMTRTVPRQPTRSVDRLGSSASRTGTVRRPSIGGSRVGGVSRSTSGASRSSPVRRSGFGSSRSGGFSRPSMSPSRSSFGGSRGFSRPSFGGFGGSRTAPVSRGR